MMPTDTMQAGRPQQLAPITVGPEHKIEIKLQVKVGVRVFFATGSVQKILCL